MSELRERPGSRVLVIDDELRLLLFCYIDEKTGEPHWVPPGGAVEAGETHADAARRELAEEVGLVDTVLQPCNWTRDFQWEGNGQTFRCYEKWFITRVAQAFALTPPEDEQIAGWRWWSFKQLEAARAEGVDIQPRRLPELATELLAQGPPATPLDVSR